MLCTVYFETALHAIILQYICEMCWCLKRTSERANEIADRTNIGEDDEINTLYMRYEHACAENGVFK